MAKSDSQILLSQTFPLLITLSPMPKYSSVHVQDCKMKLVRPEPQQTVQQEAVRAPGRAEGLQGCRAAGRTNPHFPSGEAWPHLGLQSNGSHMSSIGKRPRSLQSHGDT